MENSKNQKYNNAGTILSYFLAVTFFLSLTINIYGRNFYFSTSTGIDSRTFTQAQNPSTPWKTISKLNSFFTSLSPGDSVLFKRGEVFYGSIIIAKSGTALLPIVIGAYGTGNKPLITGFSTISSWTSLGNGVYQSVPTACKSTLNMVIINNVNTAKGRFPNTSYLSFESHIGNTAITDNQLLGTPNWTGAEVVIRKSKYSIGRNVITNHTGNKISYSEGGTTPNDNFGYFFQNDPKTLDLFGEWYLNPVTKKMQVYFGSANPSTNIIRVSTLDTLVNCRYENYINLTNLNFEGANAAAICINGGQNISVLYCGINFSGNYGVYVGNSPNFKIENCSINNSNHNSIQIFSNDAIVRFNTIKNSGILLGMARESSGSNGIEITAGDRNLIEFNNLDSIGKHGILLRGNAAVVKNNLINHFACLFDDVGGIYTVGTFVGRKILGNIILNGLGNIEGTTSISPGIKGIFLEVPSSFIEIKDNTVSTCSVSGLHFNNSHDIIIQNNLFYNNKYQFLSQNTSTNPVDYTRNLSITNNIFFSKSSSQMAMRMYSIRNDIAQFGQADSNYYCRPIDDVNVINTQEGNTNLNRTLINWQSFTGQDSHSKKSPQTITNENDILFEYNASTVNKIIPLNAVYLSVDGTIHVNSFTLLPYKSVVLIKSANQNSNIAPTIQNQNFQIYENSLNGSIVGTILASDPNAGQILSFSILSGNVNGAFSINSSSGVLTVSNSSAINYASNPSFNLVIKVQDNGAGYLSSQAIIKVTVVPFNSCLATGNISYQVWNNIGSSVTVSSLTSNINYPDNPSSTSLITSMEGTSNSADNYGARIAGYICAPTTGNYTFWIAGDDNCELWLSTNNQPINKQKIAYHTGFTSAREWNKYSTQKSFVISLVQGQSYYIEALMKDATGGDNISVGWLKPGQTGAVPSEVIPGSVLSPITAFQTILVTYVSIPSTSTINTGASITLSPIILPVNATYNSLNWTSSNSAIATVNNSGYVTGILAGTAIITATSIDGSNISGTCLVTVNNPLCSSSGNISYQVWNNIGSSVTVSSLTSNINYPGNPSSTSLITSMEGTTNFANNYGARIAGYICAPTTGNYTFWIAGDDNCELRLSTNNQPINMQKIAYHTGFTSVREWNKYSTQKSIVISLVQGQSYYIEALMKDATGGDNLSVGWLKPGQTGTIPSEVIPGSVLSPIDTEQLTVSVSSVGLPPTSSVNIGSSLILSATVLPENATNNILEWTSSNSNIAIVNSDGLVIGISNGIANITATSTDGSNISGMCAVTVIAPPCSASGNITYQIWNNIGNSVLVSSLTSNINYPDNPSSSTLIASMEGTTNLADNYGARIAGYICAPTSGSYTFWIAGDDNCELWLSTNNQPINMQKIAYHTGFTSVQEWNKYSTQKSIVISLVQGQSYYIEALMKDATGGDNLSVGWLKPGQTGTVPSEVVPGYVLSPIGLRSTNAALSNNSSEHKISLSVYPNPLTSNELNIKIENLTEEVSLQIFTLTGVLCFVQQHFNSEAITIDRNIFKNGIYIIKIYSNTFSETRKLIVK